MSDWTPQWTTKPEMATVISLFLYDRGDVGAQDNEMEELYYWAEETRMNQFLLDHCLQGMLIPTLTDDGELAFKITAKGEATAREALGMMADSGVIKPKGRKDSGNGNGNGNGKK